MCWEDRLIVATQDVSNEALEQQGAKVVSTAFLGTATIYLAVLLWTLVSPPEWDLATLNALSLAVGVGALLGWVWSFRRPIPGPMAHPILFGISLSMSCHAGMVLLLLGDPQHTANHILGAIAAGYFFFVRRWYYLALLAVICSYAGAVLMYAEWSATWRLWTGAFITGCVLSVSVFEARRRSTIVLHTLRIRAEQALADAATANAQRAQIEAIMQESQRRESLGLLAGGVAHDFNNLLMVILGNAQMALSKIHDHDPAHKHILNIEDASEQAAVLTQQMLTYARSAQPRLERLNLATRVGNAVARLRGSMRKNIEIYFTGPDHGPCISADPALLDQLLSNLVQNAAEAIDSAHGRIEIRWGTSAKGETSIQDVLFLEDMQDGEYAYIEVEDDGSGMDAHTRERMFDPFFSSKESASGLGLAAVRGILESHKAGIRVATGPQGTCLRIFLPIDSS